MPTTNLSPGSLGKQTHPPRRKLESNVIKRSYLNALLGQADVHFADQGHRFHLRVERPDHEAVLRAKGTHLYSQAVKASKCTVEFVHAPYEWRTSLSGTMVPMYAPSLKASPRSQPRSEHCDTSFTFRRSRSTTMSSQLPSPGRKRRSSCRISWSRQLKKYVPSPRPSPL